MEVFLRCGMHFAMSTLKGAESIVFCSSVAFLYLPTDRNLRNQKMLTCEYFDSTAAILHCFELMRLNRFALNFQLRKPLEKE